MTPMNHELEQHFLAEAIWGRKAELDALAEKVRPEFFADPLHYAIWTAATGTAAAGGPMTLEGLTRLIQTANADTDGKAQEYLAALAAAAMNRHPGAFVKELRDLALRRELKAVGQDIVADALIDDPARSAIDRLEAAEILLFGLAEHGGGRSEGMNMPQARLAADALIDRAQRALDGISGIPTGLHDVDQRLGGLQGGELYVIAGRPGMGKTAVALTVARNAARAGKRVRFVSLEMNAAQLYQRFYAQETGISVQDQRRHMTTDQFRRLGDAAEVINQWPIIIDDSDGQTVAQIRTRARRQKRRGGLDLLIVDYLGLIKATDPKAPKVYQIEEITTTLKRLSKELDIPVILLGQLNRGVENRDDKRPTLADLRDSGSIEQDADVVIFLYRAEYYLAKEEPEDGKLWADWSQRREAARGKAEIITAKFRQGEVGNDIVRFDGARQLFSDLEGGAG
jgi:replicative DNA helicase